MPITNPAKAEIFNEDYQILGEYATDDSRVPYYNPADSGVMIQPGEPVLLKWGASGEERVFLAQEAIRPGEISMLLKYFTVDLPADFSANVVLGDEVMWDTDNNVVSLAADVTNGFIIGDISYHLAYDHKAVKPTVDGNDRVVCATSTSTKCRIISRNQAATTKGTVTILGEVDEN